jgi:hypothetical protein
MTLKRWCGSTSGNVAVFDRHESTEVHDMDPVMSRLVFSKATVGYYAAEYARTKAIMVAVLEMKRHCAQPWRDVQDSMPPHVRFTNLLTHVNRGAGPRPPYQYRGRLCGVCGHQARVSQFPIARVDKGDGIHRSDLRFPCSHLSCLLFLAVERSASSSQPPSTTTCGHGVRPSHLVLRV